MDAGPSIASIGLFRECLAEQREVLSDFWTKAGTVLEGSGIALRPLPRAWTGFGHNRFSVLFIAVHRALGISPPRRGLYARITHCQRVWVTACDNLLDGEQRQTLLTDLPAGAPVFASAHALLVADRVFFLFLRDAERAGVLTDREAGRLVGTSLAALSASGRQEAEEEQGSDGPLPPAAVLRRVHSRKAGALFTAPLAAPAALGDLPPGRRGRDLEAGLRHFGIGVQILDDCLDLGEDLSRGRQNYLASLAAHGRDPGERHRLASWGTSPIAGAGEARPWRRLPLAFGKASAESGRRLSLAVALLCRGGLPLRDAERAVLSAALAAAARDPALADRMRAR